MGLKGTLPHRINGSRWLPHMQRALQTFFRSYPAFVSHLQDTSNSNAKASGLARLLVSSSLITFAVLLQVVYNVKTIKSKKKIFTLKNHAINFKMSMLYVICRIQFAGNNQSLSKIVSHSPKTGLDNWGCKDSNCCNRRFPQTV